MHQKTSATVTSINITPSVNTFKSTCNDEFCTGVNVTNTHINTHEPASVVHQALQNDGIVSFVVHLILVVGKLLAQVQSMAQHSLGTPSVKTSNYFRNVSYASHPWVNHSVHCLIKLHIHYPNNGLSNSEVVCNRPLDVWGSQIPQGSSNLLLNQDGFPEQSVQELDSGSRLLT